MAAGGVREVYLAGSAAGASDRELLGRFVGGRGDAASAFRAIVARHGPMVLGVCRRALRDPNDVDDAFQATFLVLVRKAPTVRVHDSLGRWLYGVSRRVAARARTEGARRARRESAGGSVATAVAGPSDDGRAEALAALDEEVARLPAHYRSAVVLCDLAGLTHEAAALELGCAIGTVASRVSRGRERLRVRLQRRGVAPGSPASPASPAVPLAMAEAAARGGVAQQATAGAVPASIQGLVDGVLKEILMTKWTMVGVGLVSLATLAGLGTVTAQRLQESAPPSRPAEAKSAEGRPDEKAGVAGVDFPLSAPPTFRIGDRMAVEVLEALPARPINGERFVRADGTISLGYYGDVYVFGLNRKEVKIKVIEHLRKTLGDRVLGLHEVDEASDKSIEVAPADSNRVFVSEVEPDRPAGGDVEPDEPAPGRSDDARRLDGLERRLDRLIKALESAERARAGVPQAGPSRRPNPRP